MTWLSYVLVAVVAFSVGFTVSAAVRRVRAWWNDMSIFP